MVIKIQLHSLFDFEANQSLFPYFKKKGCKEKSFPFQFLENPQFQSTCAGAITFFPLLEETLHCCKCFRVGSQSLLEG
jgi:hypothetical protein